MTKALAVFENRPYGETRPQEECVPGCGQVNG